MKTVLVTGATGGLGPTVVNTFITAGWQVVATFRNADKFAAIQGTRPSEELIGHHVGDLCRANDFAHLTSRLAVRHSGFNAIVHLVGGFKTGDSPEDLDEMLEVNYLPARIIGHAAETLVEQGGALIFISSALTKLPVITRPFGLEGYINSKLALNGLSLRLAKLFAGKIRVNAILAGILDTVANRAAKSDGNASLMSLESVAAPILRICHPEGQTTGHLMEI